MRNVLLVSENFPPKEGGSGRWFWELYRRLPRERVVILVNENPIPEQFDKTHDLKIIRAPLSCPEWGIKSLKGLLFYIRSIMLLRKIIKQYQIKEIHCGRVIHEGVTAWFVNKLFGIPYLCYVHGEDVETAATSREQSWLVKRVCTNSRFLICNSYNSVGLVEKLGFSTKQKCKVLHPGVDLKRFVPAEPNASFRESMGWLGKTVLLTVGRLQRRKGQDFLIQALPDLLKKHSDLLYVIVGQGECLSLLHDLVAELGLGKHVQIHTSLNDEQLIQCYQQCDLFILPNRTIENDIEGFGMVLVEAQACGKAVVAGNSGGTRETMEVNTTGTIIDCSAPSKLAIELDHILTNQSYKLWCENARTFVSERFDWEKHATEAKEIFERYEEHA